MQVLQPGDVLGRYKIEEPLARGGMAEVWSATLHGVDGFSKKLVLKTILPHLAEDPEFVKMFVNEALLAARINHPHVVQIIDLGRIDGRYFIAMEHVPGHTLRQISRVSRKHGVLIPPWFVLRTMVAVCDGLQYAHELVDDNGEPLGLVHRDVTPENIMVSFTGMVKILDFGVAKASAAASSTRAGTLKGKYAYISPEQIHGAPAAHHSDVYSVGVVLYELLTGWRPFRADNDLNLLRKVAAGNAKPAKERAPWIPETLNTIVMSALATDPAKRTPSASELGSQLLSVLKQAKGEHGQRELGMHLRSLYEGDAKASAKGTQPEPPAADEADQQPELSFASVLSVSYPSMSPEDHDEESATELADESAPNPFVDHPAGDPTSLESDDLPDQGAAESQADQPSESDQQSQGEYLVDQLRSKSGRDRRIHISGRLEAAPVKKREADWAWREIAAICDTESAALEVRARADIAARRAAAAEISRARRASQPDLGKAAESLPHGPPLDDSQPKQPAKRKRTSETRANPVTPDDDPPQGEQEATAAETEADPAATEEEIARYMEQGLDAMRAGKLHDAYYAWQKVVELDPDNRTYQLNLRKLEKRLQD